MNIFSLLVTASKGILNTIRKAQIGEISSYNLNVELQSVTAQKCQVKFISATTHS